MEMEIKSNTTPAAIEALEAVDGMGDNEPIIDWLVPEVGMVPGNVVVVSARAVRLRAGATREELQRVLDGQLRLEDATLEEGKRLAAGYLKALNLQ